MPRPPLFQRARVTRVVRETADASTFTLTPDGGPFTYRAGQFCTFRVRVDGEELLRSYSMSSAPETDAELMTTVKRVPGGRVSNWLIDNLAEGDEVELTRPFGVFCLRDTDAPLLGFSGGSGITPILSLAKSALASTSRTVRLLCADRDPDSALFSATLTALAARYPDRFTYTRHLDTDGGFLTPSAIKSFIGPDTAADAYICGPTPFMDLVESTLPGPGKLFIERFGTTTPLPTPTDTPAPAPEQAGTITIHLGRKKASVPHKTGETLLQSARRAGLTPPFSCEAGNCATCIAHITHGSATMRVNDALTPDEVAEGYTLTCQAIPTTPNITVTWD
ncbi:ferredoxin--NADP reductase [Actinocorallia sp. A-T 12471]|uniref:ferredoxin--NADP reductase n=1 Tax=Actinocorallia sp. A-T 12471 TaxID=3089813 RepID=UPI0029D36F69|nr:ferredoxin--NADP reductase [Actinocorallia sp. A-T 12471]MDX6741041.1 ferredoxin--NADP reductase [Actinocorallia sp. A-T 12471]